jgi:hypothetical protein
VPLVVELRVDFYASAEAAREGLRALRGELVGEVLEEPGLGNEAHAVTRGGPGVPLDVRFYYFAWRDRNVTAFLKVSGFEGKVRAARALALARKQARMIADAG